ncbi:MAG: nucleotidyltransferase family protein [Candidatus Micrarchaeota archaeon]|nr:nucleotidyltransferase family protein [Candidatus Micrarchaeota archaeon]
MTKAIVLCGGKGTRLRPYTYTIPKPMLPLGKKPILEYVLQTLKNAGITEVTLAVGYLHEQIKEYFGEGKKIGMKLTYTVESKEAGTAGSIVPLAGQMKETFVVMMGDHMSNIDIKALVAFHKKQGGIATVALNRKGIPLEYGVADLEGSQIVRFREKRRRKFRASSSRITGLTSAGRLITSR